MTNAEYADDQACFVNTPAQSESQLLSLELQQKALSFT